ncbi:MAG: FAD-dependent oxidoreductase, partial [Gammaproteobacteria bacterium]|nr:FAD-dependent oxidoreductase [Gammaproteobacteria bacterium]
MQSYSDVLIIGGGAAGLSLALRLAETHSISLISKGKLTEGSTYYAQGGIAAVLDQADSFDEHVADTLKAGADLGDEDVVRYVVENGPEAIQWLIDKGVPFTRDANQQPPYHLTREGGHSHRRIVHAADATGRAVETTLDQQAHQHPNIQLHEQHIAVDLITEQKLGLEGNRCLGAYVLDRQSGKVKVF